VVRDGDGWLMKGREEEKKKTVRRRWDRWKLL
jgi:hypothetical protein